MEIPKPKLSRSKSKAVDKYERKNGLPKSEPDQHVFPNAVRSLEELLEKKTEEFKESEEKYRLLFNQIPEAVWVYDIETLKFLDVNETALRRYGFSREEFLSLDIRQIRPEKELASFMEVLEKRKKDHHYHSEGTWRHLRKDGSMIWVEVTSQSIRFAGKDARLVVSKNITEKVVTREKNKNLEEQLVQSQKMEALGVLAGGIAHDFNNLLTGILGHTSLIMEMTPDTDPCYLSIKTIQDSASRASDLTKELLGFARKGKYQTRTVSLNEVAYSVLKLIERTFDKTIQVQTDLDSDLKMVEADFAQIEHTLMNLCINASNAMNGTGLLTIRTCNIHLTDQETDFFPDAHPGTYALVEVTDTGTGMDDQTLKRIFEPFFTTRKSDGGTGLGLAMVYGIVQNHGGFIKVSSQPGTGSQFQIYIPASDRIISQPSVNKGMPMKGGTERILVVDDDATIVKLGERVLSILGYKVWTASSGEEACRIYKKSMDQIDLVILDFIMPGMTGEETFEKLREIDPRVRVLLSSGYSQEGRPQVLVEKGVQGFIQKPYIMQTLADAVREAMDKPFCSLPE